MIYRFTRSELEQFIADMIVEYTALTRRGMQPAEAVAHTTTAIIQEIETESEEADPKEMREL